MPLRVQLRTDLQEAKTNDGERVALIRTLIGSIDNAEAVDVQSAAVSGEVPRRRLSDKQIMQIVLRESAELRAAAEDYEQRGQSDEAGRLRSLSLLADGYAQDLTLPQGKAR